MKLTKQISTWKKQYNLELEDLVFADLLFLGWNMTDAYVIAYGKGLNWDLSIVKQEADTIYGNPKIRQRINDMAQSKAEVLKKNMIQTYSDDDENVDIAKESSKENAIRELVLAKRQYQPGSQEWRDLQKQIIEVTQMKKDEVKEEDTTVHYYLPLKCDKCALYQKHKKKYGTGNNKADSEDAASD